MLEAIATVPSFVCAGIVFAAFLAVLAAPARYVRPSLLMMFIAMLGYAAVLAITMAGSFSPTQTPTDPAATSDTTPAPDAPSDGTSEGY
jgi:hypothetical protein